jgi:hypothetical protein
MVILPGVSADIVQAKSSYMAVQYAGISSQIIREVSLKDFFGYSLLWQRKRGMLGHGWPWWGTLPTNDVWAAERYYSGSDAEIQASLISIDGSSVAKRRRRWTRGDTDEITRAILPEVQTKWELQPQCKRERGIAEHMQRQSRMKTEEPHGRHGSM